MDNPTFQGIIPPMVTPFTETEAVDETAFRAEVRHLVGAGVHGLAVAGSTGEGHTLTRDETALLVRLARAEAAGRVPVIAGIIQNSTRAVIEYGLAARDAGADALQITPVHYLFTPTEAGTIAYFEQIGRAVDLPILIYNVIPWNTLSPALLLRLSEIRSVVGVKQSGGDLHKLADLLRENRGRLQILSAVDDLLYPSFMLGAHGAIAAILTILPDLCVQLWQAVLRGEHAAARTLHERILAVWRPVSAPDMTARVKAAIELRGRRVGEPRGPLLGVTPAVRAEVAEGLAAAGLLRANVA